MTSSTRTKTETTTITAADVREVMQFALVEITTIANAASHVMRDFDLDSAIVDLSILALNAVIAGFHLQFHQDEEIIREYSFHVIEGPGDAFGPPADQPPLGAIPSGAGLRLVATPNPQQAASYCNAWFQRLGWIDAPALIVPADVHTETYGSHRSGDYGLERRLMTNPKFDRPATSGRFQMRKERAL